MKNYNLTDFLNNKMMIDAINFANEIIKNNKKLFSEVGILSELLHAESPEFDVRFKKTYEYSKKILDRLDDCLILCVFDRGFYNTIETYKKRNIPLKILRDSLKDLELRCEFHYKMFGKVGTDAPNWTKLFIQGKIFRLGRLQYMPQKCHYDTLIYKNKNTEKLLLLSEPNIKVDGKGYKVNENESFITGEYNKINCNGRISPACERLDLKQYQLVFKNGDDVLDMHIPANGHMTPDMVKESMEMALEFCKKHFSELSFKAFSCYSWLLGEEMEELLSPNSNIIQFKNLFDLTSSYNDTHPLIYKWIFGFEKNQTDYKNHIAENSLQRGAHKLLDEGRWFTSRAGIILI